jgi:thioesterase domain-containing protein
MIGLPRRGRIADQYLRRHKFIIVLIGHSLGGNAIFDIANALDKQNIPVELMVSLDATKPQPVPKNVLHAVSFFQQNGFGKKVVADLDFKGELNNIDLIAETGLSHTTIDKSPRLHAMVMQKIADVVQKDLAKRTKPSKTKRKSRNQRRLHKGQSFRLSQFAAGSTLVQVASGLNDVMASAIFAVSGPRSFWNTVPP